MIRVLHFVSTPSIGSGVMSVIMNYYRHLDRSKIQFDFLCFIPCEDSYEKEINELGGRVFFVAKPSSLHAVKELFAFFKEHKGEYVWFHNHEVYLSFLLKWLVRVGEIKKFIIHSHATQYSDRYVASIRNRFLCMPITVMKCERFACSLAAGKFLYEGKVKKRKFHVLPNAIEVDKYKYQPEIRAQYRKTLSLENCFVLGHVGRFVPQKNHRYLISLFQQLHAQIPDSKLILIGDGPLMDEIQQLVKEKGLDNHVCILGKRNDVATLLSCMDMFLLPSIYEGLPVACIEAQAAGLPCIISDSISSEVLYNERIKAIPLEKEEEWIEVCNQIYEESTEFPSLESRQCSWCIPNIHVTALELQKFYEMGVANFEKIF